MRAELRAEKKRLQSLPVEVDRWEEVPVLGLDGAKLTYGDAWAQVP